jgi:hypothetical protein
LRSPSCPEHGSWLNLIEGFLSKFARSVLRHIQMASKQELKACSASRTSIVTRSSTLGLTNSPGLPNMIRAKETLTLDSQYVQPQGPAF